MNDLNCVAIVGRLTKDCDVRTLGNSDTMKLTLNIAVNVSTKNKEGKWEDLGHFFKVEYFTKSMSVSEYLKKGKQVAIQGSLRLNRFEKADHSTYSEVLILANSVSLVGGSKQETSNSQTISNNSQQSNMDDIPF